jgi:hypothetical protein
MYEVLLWTLIGVTGSWLPLLEQWFVSEDTLRLQSVVALLNYWLVML